MRARLVTIDLLLVDKKRLSLSYAILKSLCCLSLFCGALDPAFALELSEQNLAAKEESSHSAERNSLALLENQFIQESAWINTWQQRSDYLDCLIQINAAIDAGMQSAMAQQYGSSPLIHLNPWGDIHQSIPFDPELGPLLFWTGDNAMTPVPAGLTKSIPNRFLLAEALGLGTNQAHLIISTEDGQLFTSNSYGFHIAARERYALVGSFHLNSQGVIQTFHHSILSRSRVNTQDIHLGPGVKPHQIQLKRTLLEELPKKNKKTLWELERLDLRYPSQFNSVERSPQSRQDGALLEEQMGQAIEARFHTLKLAITDTQLESLKKSSCLANLDNLHRRFSEWESAHSVEPNCPIGLKANRLLTSVALKRQLRSQIDQRRPWKLDQQFMSEMETALNASLAHGLYHRVTPARRLEALQIYLALMEESNWPN